MLKMPNKYNLPKEGKVLRTSRKTAQKVASEGLGLVFLVDWNKLHGGGPIN